MQDEAVWTIRNLVRCIELVSLLIIRAVMVGLKYAAENTSIEPQSKL
jgi:hypothetical protein